MDDARIREAQDIIARDQEQPTNLPEAIDPPRCGCTECITGLYRPIDQASDDEIIAMLLGEIDNHSGYSPGQFQVRDDGMVITPPWI